MDDNENIKSSKDSCKDISEKDRTIPFIITTSYMLSFLFIRLAVIIAGSSQSPASMAAKSGELNFYIGTNVILFGYHIHHLTFGIILIALAGWFSIVGSSHFTRRDLALMYGIGLGLFMDEVGMLLSWGSYWSTTTYILSVLLAGIFLIIVFFPGFWKEFKGKLKHANPQHFTTSKGIVKHIIKGVDIMAEKTEETRKTSLVFSGIVYIGVGMLIIAYPGLVYYWVAGGFLLQGLSSLVRAWKS